MQADEYERMARVEDRHWWYRGLRDVVARSLQHPELRLAAHPRVLDAGCGTGANLKLLAALLEPSYLGGFDVSEEAVRRARAKEPGADVYRADLTAPEVHTEALDLVVSLDVIYIPGVARALPGLAHLVALLRPGGLFVVNLPAYDWLYAEHDLAVHTTERYTTRRVAALFGRLGLSVERLSYRVFFLFPAVVAARIPGWLRVRAGRGRARSDLARGSSGLAGEALYRTLRLENAWIAAGRRLPWGTSVFAVGRKRASPNR